MESVRAGLWPLSRVAANLSFRIKSLLLVSLPVAALALSLVLGRQAESVRIESEELTKNATEIRAQLQNIYILMTTAESEVRNFGLNGREEGLQPLGMIGPTIDGIFTKVRDLDKTGHSNDQISRAKHLVFQRLDGLKQLRAFYTNPGMRGTPAPADLIQQARISPDLVVALTELGGVLIKSPVDRLKALQSQRLVVRLEMTATGILGAVGAILAALWFAAGISGRLRKLKQCASDLEEGRALTCVPGGSDELGALARALESAGQTAAARSEELKLALEGAEILIWELEIASDAIRYQVGSGALRNARIPAELLQDTVEKWIAGVMIEDRDRLRRELYRVAAEGGSLQIEYRVVLTGGETRWMSIKAQSHSTAGEKPQRLLGILADVTKEKRAAQEIERQGQELIASREALQQQTRILQSILDSMGDAIVVSDTKGNFLLQNPAAKEILGEHSFAGEHGQWSQHYGLFLPDMVTLYPKEELPTVRAIRGESVDGAEIFIRPAGAIAGKWASVTARPLRQEDGAVRGAVVVIRDITASRHAAEALKIAKQEAEDANHAKSEFLSRMSHELRTPLNSILGFAQILELGELTEQQESHVEHILKGGYHLLELINEILDLARIEAGRMSLSPEPVLIREAIQDAVDLLQPLAVQQNVTLNAMGAHCGRHVRADRQRLKQVLLNLLSNAIKYNRPAGSVVVSCSEPEAGRLRVEIVDTGAGIPPEGLKKIFKPFERLDADKSDVSGTGLGLALSKRLVEAMGGTLGVESALGLGSRFFMDFVVVEDPADWLQTDEGAVVLAESPIRSHRGTVLYIEDNTSNLRLVEQVFSHSPDVALLSAMEGRLGLDLAELHAPDWILLDVHLPDIPGDEVLRRLRANPRTQRIPVTVLSADATPGQINRLMAAGARDYLTKPLDVRKLLSLLEQTIPNGKLVDAR